VQNLGVGRVGGRRASIGSDGGKALSQACREAVHVIAHPVAKVRVGNPEHGFVRRPIADIKVEHERGIDIISQASDRLVSGLPVAVVEEDPSGMLRWSETFIAPMPTPRCGVIGQPVAKSYGTLVMTELE
jgi:hypothetical protein